MAAATHFPHISEQMIAEVDKADSAKFVREDILNPQGWVLLSFLMDPRTGLGRFRDFRVSNYQLMMQLIDYCREHTIEEILNLPDVRERIELYQEHHDRFVAQIRRCTKVHGSVAVLDLRAEEVIYAGNRFMIYALYPECELSIHVIHGLKQQNTVLAAREIDFQPKQQGQDRGSSADVWRRRSRCSRNLPGCERIGRSRS